MKKEYIKFNLEIVELCSDIVATSGCDVDTGICENDDCPTNM